jgi:hypothetical protein
MYALGLKRTIMITDVRSSPFMQNVLCMHSFLWCFQVVFKPMLTIEPSDWEDQDEDKWENDITWGHYDSDSEEWVQL